MSNKGKEPKPAMQKWSSQVRKGLLDFIILLYLKDRSVYGYELVREIREFTSMDISEGTIYPLLKRLKKEGHIDAEWKEMDTGLPRRYYHITPKGKQSLKEMEEAWHAMTSTVTQLLKKRI